jgi:type IV pilus assembly protein PilO
MAILDPITNAPRPHKIIAGAFGLVVLAGLGYYLFIAPSLTERASLQQQHEALRIEVQKAQADEANVRPFRAQAESLRRRLEAAKERLPSEKEMPRLYRQLTDLAFQSGLHLALFAPKAPEDREDVAEVPINMAAEGGYHQVGAFFARVSRLPRIVNLGDFKMAGIERPTGSMRADLTLATFVFRPEGAPPSARAATSPKPGTPAASAPAVTPSAAKPGRVGQ